MSKAQSPIDSVCVDTALIGILPEKAIIKNDRSFRDFIRRTGHSIKTRIRELDRTNNEYIEPNHYDWTVMLQNSNFIQILSMASRTETGHFQTLSFRPQPMLKIGPYIGWRWIFLGYSIDVSRPSSAGRATDFNLSVYSSKLGGDIVYLHNNGKFLMGMTKGFNNIGKFDFKGTQFTGLEVNTLSINAYYVLNHRKLSYPAAYNQSTIQKRSAGSVIFGCRYDRQKMNFDYKKLPFALIGSDSTSSVLSNELKFSNLSYQDFCISFGYAYNWVFARNCLFAISATPALGYRAEKGTKVKYDKFFNNAIRYVAMDFIGRVGVVWNTGKKFLGASYVTHLYSYHNHHLTIANSVNYINFYIGLYFGKKPKYKQLKHF